jgi:ATP-dependent Zn protease
MSDAVLVNVRVFFLHFLLRPGRFGRRLLMNRPDRGGLATFLRVHMRKVPVSSHVRVEQVAALTPGFSGESEIAAEFAAQGDSH